MSSERVLSGVQGAPDLEQAQRQRHRLVVLLTLVTGCADATGFIALGGAFSSVMTGNMVLLGLSAGQGDADLAVTSGAAIASYIVGVLVGASVAGRARAEDPVWPSAVTRALMMELLVFAGFIVLWELTQGHRGQGGQLGLLAVAAGALGIQSSAVQRFGQPGLSSTYLTGTLTSLIGAVAARHSFVTMVPRLQVLGALIVGASAGAVVVLHIPRASPAVLIVPLVLAIVGSKRLGRSK